VRIGVNGSTLRISGAHPEQALAGKVLSELYEIVKQGHPIYPSDVEYSVRILRADGNVDLKDIFLDTIYISAHKRVIAPKSVNQKRYIDAIRSHDIVFGIGPAGTGKTYLAMAMALAALMKNQVTRMVLLPPAVEAGEPARFFAGRPGREGQPVPAAALRRAARHGRFRPRAPDDGARHDRGRAARLHARAHLERLLHHP